MRINEFNSRLKKIGINLDSIEVRAGLYGYKFEFKIDKDKLLKVKMYTEPYIESDKLIDHTIPKISKCVAKLYLDKHISAIESKDPDYFIKILQRFIQINRLNIKNTITFDLKEFEEFLENIDEYEHSTKYQDYERINHFLKKDIVYASCDFWDENKFKIQGILHKGD